MYLNLLNSSFQGTVDVSIYGRNPGSQEENFTNVVSSFTLTSRKKYYLYNLVNEKHYSEARILFKSDHSIDINCEWNPDSSGESDCIIITGYNKSKYSTIPRNILSVPHESLDKASFLLKVPYLSQRGIPAGCEGISTTMLLKYYGFNISKEDFINKYLPQDNWTYQSAPDPDEAFIGNPYKSSGNNYGFGCYAGCIVKAINKFISDKNIGNEFRVKKFIGDSLDTLIKNYIRFKIPVLIWATMNMTPSTKNGTLTWTLNNGPRRGQKFTWRAGEHCLVFVGYNSKSYFFNDPYQSNKRSDWISKRYCGQKI